MNFDDVLRFGSMLSQLPDRDTYLRVVRGELARLIPGDDVLWIRANDTTGSGCVVLRGEPWQLDPELSTGLSFYWRRHPHPQSYTRDPKNRTPRRMSDIVAPRRWREMEEFRALKAGMHQYQLSIIPPPPFRYRGWLICRDEHDFDDTNVDTATAIAPVLAVLGPLYDRIDRWNQVADSPANVPALTARELAVLHVLDDGLPAHAIGHRLSISPGTVDKHLEHIYRKLGCNDRLVAVTIAHRIGLLPQNFLRGDPNSAKAAINYDSIQCRTEFSTRDAWGLGSGSSCRTGDETWAAATSAEIN